MDSLSFVTTNLADSTRQLADLQTLFFFLPSFPLSTQAVFGFFWLHHSHRQTRAVVLLCFFRLLFRRCFLALTRSSCRSESSSQRSWFYWGHFHLHIFSNPALGKQGLCFVFCLCQDRVTGYAIKLYLGTLWIVPVLSAHLTNVLIN